jgi:molybdopterin molybdotransferase
MRTVEEALRTILDHCRVGPEELRPLLSALHQTLAWDVSATSDSPPFDKSLMDGFAVQAPAREQPAAVSPPGDWVTLNVLATLTAGQVPTATVSGRDCVRIMTGSPLPAGCNCVVPIEQTRFDPSHPHSVEIPRQSLRPEANIMRRGMAIRAGSPLLCGGTRIQPQHIAALAEFGISQVPIRRPPAIAVLATGDELVPFDQTPPSGSLRNSNEPMLLAQIHSNDAIPIGLGIAPDRNEPLRERIDAGLQHDVLLLSGGVSAGLLDLVPSQLQLAGVQPVFHGVNMKPGKPLWFGVFHRDGRRCLVFGLPGNPVSSLACFELFVRPVIHFWLGRPARLSPLQATLTAPITVSGSRPVYHPSRIEVVDSHLRTTPVPWSGSSDLAATTHANGMTLLRPDHGPYQAGDVVEVHQWEQSR